MLIEFMCEHASTYPVPKPSSQNDSEGNFKEMKFRAGRVQSSFNIEIEK